MDLGNVTAVEPTPFGLRDFAAYLCPGLISIGNCLLLVPESRALLSTYPIAASIALVPIAYLIGTVWKSVGIFVLENVRRLFRSPYRWATQFEDKTSHVWTPVFSVAILAALSTRFGASIVAAWIRERPSELVLMCWYDLMERRTGGVDEIVRYVALYNLCLCAVPAAAVLAGSAWYLGLKPLFWGAAFAVAAFVGLWDKYERSFCRAILRLWYLRSLNSRPVSFE